jgi:hypothetical protein
MVAGGGACELRLAAHLKVLADKTPGLEQVRGHRAKSLLVFFLSYCSGI